MTLLTRTSSIPPATFKVFPFRFSYPRGPSKTLCESIKESGILTPLLAVNSDSGPLVLDGHRRLFAARALKHPQIPVTFLTDTAPENLPRIWLRTQRVFRTLNPFEMALFIKNGRRVFNLPSSNLLAALNAEPGIKAPENLPRILTLPPRLKQTAVRRGYSMRFLLKMTALYPPPLLTAVSNLLLYFIPGENQINNLLEWTYEISRRDHLSPEAVLASEPLLFILRHPGMPSAKKRDAFLRQIFFLRFPERAELGEKFDRIARKLGPLGIKCTGPDFTGDTFELRLAFKNPEELKALLKKADRSIGEIAELFKLV